MKKTDIHLSLDHELYEIAKSRGINLSQAFEDYVRAILNVDTQEQIDENFNPEEEIAKHLAELKRLQSLKEKKEEAKTEKHAEELFWDHMVDQIMEEYKNTLDSNQFFEHGRPTLEQIIESRANKGIPYLYRKKFNKNINTLLAKEKIKELIKLKEVKKDAD